MNIKKYEVSIYGRTNTIITSIRDKKLYMDFAKNPLLDIGDEFKVVEIETEV